ASISALRVRARRNACEVTARPAFSPLAPPSRPPQPGSPLASFRMAITYSQSVCILKVTRSSITRASAFRLSSAEAPSGRLVHGFSPNRQARLFHSGAAAVSGGGEPRSALREGLAPAPAAGSLRRSTLLRPP